MKHIVEGKSSRCHDMLASQNRRKKLEQELNRKINEPKRDNSAKTAAKQQRKAQLQRDNCATTMKNSAITERQQRSSHATTG